MSVLIKANNRKTLPLRFDVKGWGYSSEVEYSLRNCEGPGFNPHYPPPAPPKKIWSKNNICWLSCWLGILAKVFWRNLVLVTTWLISTKNNVSFHFSLWENEINSFHFLYSSRVGTREIWNGVPVRSCWLLILVLMTWKCKSPANPWISSDSFYSTEWQRTGRDIWKCAGMNMHSYLVGTCSSLFKCSEVSFLLHDDQWPPFSDMVIVCTALISGGPQKSTHERCQVFLYSFIITHFYLRGWDQIEALKLKELSA